MIAASAALAATTVNVWCWDTNFNGAAMKAAAAAYNKAHPDVTIKIDVTMQQQDIRNKLQTQLLANATEGLPDIVLIEDDVAQKYLQSFPDAFVPLGDSIDMKQFAQYKVTPGHLQRQVLLAALRLRRDRLLLPLRLPRCGRLQGCRPAGYRLGQVHRDRQGREGQDRPQPARPGTRRATASSAS